MATLDRDRLCRDFEACIAWPYDSPGSNDQYGIDCSGMFVRAFRLQGARIYHGSNTIWRKHLTRKGAIGRQTRLYKGLAVFKWKEEGDPQQDGLGNFHHIGLITSVEPLRIVHASTVGMKVKADESLKDWTHWGALAGVRYPAEEWLEEITPAQRPLLRYTSRGNDVRDLQLMLREVGFELEADGIFGPITRECVKSFQAKNNLAVDGLVGPLTWGKLEAMVC